MVAKVLQLKCKCNEYPWGKQGSKSIAARLCAQTPGTDFKIDESECYSEMWMGTYPVLPSYVVGTGEDLQDVIDKHPDELLGKDIVKKFGHSKLPYLPKVLSIAKALPLQLHPNRSMSEELHKKDPDQFTDPNHKPEIAVALGDFEAFVGFKPLEQIEKLMKLEPLQQFLPTVKKPSFDNQQLKYLVGAILKADDDVIAKVQEDLKKLPKDSFGPDTYIPEMIPRLQGQFDKTDPGIIVALITMNYLQLKAGESIYIPADGIHAYLSGDIIECMARSNNVLNTGFCPSAERNSVDLFTSCLTFTPHDPQEPILKEENFKGSKNSKTTAYDPPMSEFTMLRTQLKSGEKETVEPIGPSVMIATKGGGKMVTDEKTVDIKEGYVFFVGQGVETNFEASKDMELWRAFVD